MAFAQLSKVRLEYFPHGDGPERVVFAHGFRASARIWGMTQGALPADRFSSIAVNHRGAGGSDAPADERDYSIPIFAADLFELVTQLGWRDFTLVGHSLGGGTAAQFAVEHPSLLKGLVLLDPVDPDGVGGGQAAEGAVLDQLIDARMAARREALARGDDGEAIAVLGTGAEAEMRQALADDMRAAPEARLRGSMRSMFGLRLGERVKSLPMPVLLACGDADEQIPLARMLASWAKYPAGAGLHVWHGVGHSPNLDCPQELALVLRRFVEQTIPARAKAAAA